VSTRSVPAERSPGATDGAGDRGRAADAPQELPTKGWKDVLVRVKAEAKEDQLTFLAGGVAFFALIAIVPGLVALVSLFGLVADPAEVQRQVSENLAAAPSEVRDLVSDQLEGVTSASNAGLGIGLVVGIVLAVWAASSGMKNLIAAINTVYDERESRSFVPLRGLALALTLGAILFLAVAFLVVAVVPSALEDSALGPAARWAVVILRWPALALGWMGGLAVLYRLAPDRQDAKWRWVTPGAVVATVVWLLGSLAFSAYTAGFASYNETYGALGAVVITMLWLQLTALAILLGAEVNAELEHQTVKDSTTGPERPLGERGAVMADTVGPPAEVVKAAKG
jgi:membrane protein